MHFEPDPDSNQPEIESSAPPSQDTGASDPQPADQPADSPSDPPTDASNGGAAAAVPADASAIRDPNASETTAIDRAEAERASALAGALQLIDALLAKRPQDDGDGGSGAPTYSSGDQRVIDAVGRWLLIPDVNATFWDSLSTSRDLISQNQALKADHHIDPVKNDYAYVYGSGNVDKGVFFCMPFFNTNPDCRHEVITHEYFHFLGLDHYYSTTLTEEALKCAHHMAELVFDVATGCTLGCGNAASSCHP